MMLTHPPLAPHPAPPSLESLAARLTHNNSFSPKRNEREKVAALLTVCKPSKPDHCRVNCTNSSPARDAASFNLFRFISRFQFSKYSLFFQHSLCSTLRISMARCNDDEKHHCENSVSHHFSPARDCLLQKRRRLFRPYSM